MSYSKLILDGASRIIGCLLVFSGAWGVIDPLHVGGKIFAVSAATSETVVFYPGLAGRNLGAGLAVLSLSFSSQRKALGKLLLCWMCAGLADTRICLTNPSSQNTWIHIMNTGILAVVGTGLLSL